MTAQPGAPLDLFVTCPAGLSEWLATELADAGATDIEPVQAGAHCCADRTSAYRINLQSRIASRVLQRVSQGRYRTDKDVFRLAQRIDWGQYLHPDRSLRVDTRAVRSGVKSVNMVTLRVKDAIVDCLREQFDARPDINTTQPDTHVVVYLQDRQASFYLDLSGESLFKRGWRLSADDKGAAPIKENLAAALLAASGWDLSAPLFDPFCGSGTLLIEAAQMISGVAPGMRREFALEMLGDFDESAWDQAREAAKSSERSAVTNESPKLFGSDIDSAVVRIAKDNAKRAGLTGDAIQWHAADFLQSKSPCERPGWLIANLPYGERMSLKGIASGNKPDNWAQLGNHLRSHFAGWTVCLLSADRQLPGKLRLRPARKIPVYNGTLDCRLFIFQMAAK